MNKEEKYSQASNPGVMSSQKTNQKRENQFKFDFQKMRV
jgi:hypothetical protein